MKTRLFFLFAILVAFDQIAKNVFFTRQSLGVGGSNTFCNKNLAWNIPVPGGIFYFAWIIIVVAIIFIFFRTKDNLQRTLLTFILSGAVSNMIDRIRFGCVVDYIDLKFFPVFNLADAYITFGIIALLLIYIKYKILNTRY